MRIILKPVADLTPEEQAALRALSAAVHPPDIAATWPGRAIEWAPRQCSVICWDDEGHALSHAGALIREGMADGNAVRIGGIGGVMTHPASRRQGLAKQAIHGALRHFADQKVDFALLVCDPALIPLYSRIGWRIHPGDLLVRQHGQTVKFTFNVTMIRPVTNAVIPNGAIDLLGPPW